MRPCSTGRKSTYCSKGACSPPSYIRNHPNLSSVVGHRVFFLMSTLAVRIECDLDGLSLFLAFNLVGGFTVLQPFHGLQTIGAAKVLFRRRANRCRQFAELNRDLGPQHRSVRVGNDELEVLAADGCLDVINGLSALDLLGDLINVPTRGHFLHSGARRSRQLCDCNVSFSLGGSATERQARYTDGKRQSNYGPTIPSLHVRLFCCLFMVLARCPLAEAPPCRLLQGLTE